MGEHDKPEPFSVEMVGLFDPAKRPSKTFFAPTNLLRPIALLVLSWDAFDRGFDDLLFALTRATGAPVEDTGNDFKKRRRQVRKLSAQVFSACPAIAGYIADILEDSSNPYNVRNFIVHSHVWIKMQAGEVKDGAFTGISSIVCIKAKRGKPPLRAEYTVSNLEEAVYQIGHLSGRLDALCTNSEALAFASPDRSFLAEFLKKDYRSSSISPI